MGLWDEESARRTLGIRDRQILHNRAGHKCENCGKNIEFSDLQVGHKTAYSKGGSTTLKNSVALCYGCNKLQGTDSWQTFQRKQGKTDTEDKLRDVLSRLSIRELKYIASKHKIKLKSRYIEGGLFESGYHQSPSKQRYIKELSKVVSENEIRSVLNDLLNSRLQ